MSVYRMVVRLKTGVRLTSENYERSFDDLLARITTMLRNDAFGFFEDGGDWVCIPVAAVDYLRVVQDKKEEANA